jgi:hypothetical protein
MEINVNQEEAQLERLRQASGARSEPTQAMESVLTEEELRVAATVRESIRWPERNEDAQGADYVVTRPRWDNHAGYVAGVLPKPVVPVHLRGELRDVSSIESQEYTRLNNIRVSANVAFERVLCSMRAKHLCKIVEDTAEVMRHDAAIQKDMQFLVGLWSAYGIAQPSDEQMRTWAGIEEG